ncbi:MAG: pantoate--beta-alanine ligase [Bacteroidota bacterium]|nr:pantoate--beta-alanine ligase [Bacteroidota bacterium]
MKTFASYKNLNNELRNKKGALSLVPTMGSLHQGHISLIQTAIKKTPNVVVSIFVNPTQFENKTDLKNYPKNLKNDLSKLKALGNLLVYMPDIKELYPKKVIADEYNFGELDKIMEGKFRSNHFNGVATIVEKLFTIFKPDFAFFGEKDFQQLTIIKSLVNQKGLKTKIVSCPTIREDDGLAMSSRNHLLSKEERAKAIVLYHALLEAKELIVSTSPIEIEKSISLKFANIEGVDLEYFKILTTNSFSKTKKLNRKDKYRAFIACILGKVRLIDNIILE